jgi:pilus assembly protein CpaB
VTLELTPGQAETLAASKQAGHLSLALRSVVDTAKGAEDEDPGSRRSGVSVVRFGVSTTSSSK